MMRERVFAEPDTNMSQLDSLRIQLADKDGRINILEEHKEQLK
jgi:hypothetical protein